LSVDPCFVDGLTGIEDVEAVLVVPSMASWATSLVAWFGQIGMVPLSTLMKVQ